MSALYIVFDLPHHYKRSISIYKPTGYTFYSPSTTRISTLSKLSSKIRNGLRLEYTPVNIDPPPAGWIYSKGEEGVWQFLENDYRMLMYWCGMVFHSVLHWQHMVESDTELVSAGEPFEISLTVLFKSFKMFISNAFS